MVIARWSLHSPAGRACSQTICSGLPVLLSCHIWAVLWNLARDSAESLNQGLAFCAVVDHEGVVFAVC